MKPLPPVSRLDLDHILDHTRDLWDELRGQRIFITGGTGFFGCWLLESFTWAVEQLGLDTQAFVLTRSPDTFRQKVPHLAKHQSVTLIKGDVRNFEFPEGPFEYIIHAASETSLTNTPIPSSSLFNAIVQGANRVIKFSQMCGTKKMLFTSSGAVYGKQPVGITHLSEDYLGAPPTTEPASAYGQGKRAAEFLCIATAQNSSLEVKIARCFAFVGPYLPLDANFAIGNFIRDSLYGSLIHIEGDGTPHRSYLYAADLTIWLWIILLRGGNQMAYNVGSEKDLSIIQLAKIVRDIVNPKCQIVILGKVEPRCLPDRYVPSTKTAQSELGLKVYITLEEAVNRTIKWHRRFKKGK